MKKILILSFIFIFSLSVFAGFVPLQNAEKVAKSHVFQTVASFKSLEWNEIRLDCLFDPSQNDIYKFYVFNINGDQGYVIVSSDDQIIPILAYSFEGGFNFDNMSPGQADFLNYFNESIAYVKKNEINVNEKAINQWQELLDFDQTKSFQLKSTSPILLQGINWNQNWPYNSQCPEEANASGYGFNGHVPVGCVATAMLQVMKYYNWPPTGTGSKYHSSYMNGGYGNIAINFSQQTYDWTAIPDQASTYENPELGKINYHASVAVSTYWSYEGSGATTNNVAQALKNYFKYSQSVQYVQKSNYSESGWANLIKQQIDAKKPVVYAGSPSSGAGHAWNCDGYQDDSFHINWGWGGAGDGYYTLDNLISTATAGGEEYNFNQNNEMIIDIYPDTGYPEYCQSEKLITGSEGSFDDGSGPEDYQANQSCVYEINPDCGYVVSLTFTKFDIGDGDVVELYDGDKYSTKLIAAFDKDNLPTTDTYTAFLGGMTIRFNTDASSQADGWKVKYNVENCKLNMHFTEPQGTLSDGSKSCDYKNSTFCSWIIEPDGAIYINIDFVQCQIADDYDYVKIFKDAISADNELYRFNNSMTPDGIITVPSGKAIVQFYTNSSGVDEGWELNYTSSSIIEPPVADFIGNPTTIEVGQNVNFTDLSTNYPTSWSWTFEGGTPTTSNEQNPTVTYMVAGTYDVSLTVANQSDEDNIVKNAYITVISQAEPIVADFTWTGTQCSGNTIEFTDASIPVGNNCVWEVNGNIVNEGSSTFSYTFPTVSTPTDFQVSLHVSSGDLTADTTKTITIYPLPTVAISTANQNVCQGETATLTASGATNYEWSTTEMSNEINITVNESTTFYVTGTDINSCVNTASIDMYVIIHGTTVVYDELCEGDVYDFYGTNLTQQGTYYHTLTSPNTGCDSVIQLELTVNPLPQQVVVLQTPSNGILPEGTNGSITLSTSIVGTNYWVTMGGAFFTNEINGTGNMLNLGNNYPSGSYDVKSRNQHNCSLVQGTVNFTTGTGGNTGAGKIVANITFGTPASNFPANHVKVKLYKKAIGIDDSEVIVYVTEQTLGTNGQAEFLNLEPGDYYMGSFILYPDNYNVSEHVYYQTAVVHEEAISIPIFEETVFIANLHHVLLAESQGSNEMQGVVGTNGNTKSLNPKKDMVVVLKNVDIDEIIGVSVTNEEGQYYFEDIPENANIQAFVTSFVHQNWVAFEVETGIDQTYNVNFIIDGTSVYPSVGGVFDDIQIQNIKFTVFPNPAKEVLNINCDVEQAIVQIFDINGKLILTDLAFSNSEINISELVSGTYIIILSAENGKTGVQKFVKE